MNSQPYDICTLCVHLANARDLKTTLNTLVYGMSQLMGAKGASLRLLNEKDRTLEIVAAYGLTKDYLEKGPLVLEENPIDREVLKGKAVSTSDIEKEPLVLYREEARREGIKSILSIPLAAGEKAIGVIRVYKDTIHEFSDAEIESLKAFAAIGGILVDRARLWEQMCALTCISQSITSSLSLDEVLQLIVKNAQEALGMRAASIRLLSDEKNTLEVKAAYGLSKSYIEKGPVKVDKSPLDGECLNGAVVSIQDIEKDSRLQYREELLSEGIRALISLPLVVRGASIGVLRVYAPVPYTFSDSDQEFLAALASQGAIAIENARLFEHVRREYEDLTKDVWRWYDWGARSPQI